MNLIVAADAAWGIGKDGEQMVYIAPTSSASAA